MSFLVRYVLRLDICGNRLLVIGFGDLKGLLDLCKFRQSSRLFVNIADKLLSRYQTNILPIV